MADERHLYTLHEGIAWRHVGPGLRGTAVDLVEPGADARHGEHAVHELIEHVLALRPDVVV